MGESGGRNAALLTGPAVSGYRTGCGTAGSQAAMLYAIIAFSVCIPAVLVALRGLTAAFSWVLAALLVYAVASGLSKTSSAGRSFRLFSLLWFCIISAASLYLTACYLYLHGSDFGPDFDDSFYFSNVAYIAAGETVENATLYEYLLTPWYLMISLFADKVSNLDMLPLNWAAGAVAAALAQSLAETATGNAAAGRWTAIGLIANCVFLISVAHLYRD